MTRKKSKVKALALAVTCAILAGGYSGVGTVYAADASSNNTHDGNTSINGTLTVKGSLTLKEQASGTSDALEYLDIARLSKINHLINYSANGTQTVITAGDGSTVGGVGFNAGALTGVTSINANDEYAKFRVATSSDESNIKLGYLTITATNDGVKFTDTNRDISFTIAGIDTIDYRTKTVGRGFDSTGNVKDTFTSLGDKLKVYDKRKVGSDPNDPGTSLDLVTIKGDLYVADNYSTIVKEEDSKFYVKGSDGSLKAADGKFTVDKYGAIKAADNNFIVDNKGAITAAGNKFYVKEDGKVQIEDELVISHAGSGTEADHGKSATLNIDKLTSINKLMQVTGGVDSKVVYDTSGNPLITAGDGSTIGGVTISGGQLSVSQGKVNVTDLVKDHDLVNDADKGNAKLYSEINLVKGFANGIDDRTGGITRADDPSNSSWSATIIEENFKVENNGTATISEGFKAGADGKNSLTITGLKTTEIRAGNNNTEFFVDGGGNVVADGTLSAAGSKFFVSSEGNITASGSLSVAGDKFRVNADGSINANNKFNIDTNGALRAANDKFTADKDGNVRAIGSLSAASNKFFVGTDGSINVNQKFIVDADGTISSEGTLSVAGGKFFVDADGALTSASGSKIGGVTIDDESLSNGTKSIKVSELKDDHDLVNDSKKGNESLYTGLGSVQTLAQGLDTRTAGIERDTTGTTIEGKFKVGSDGTVGTVNGNFKVDADGNIVSNGTLSVANGAFVVNADGLITAGSMKMDNIEAADPNRGVTVGGVNLKNNNIKATGGKFNEIIVNENTASQVKIDSNGIKVGNNSAFVSEDGFKTSGYLYVGTKTSPTEDATDARFYVNGSDGSFKAADGAFTVDGDGKLTSKSGSKIGGVTIDGESLSNGSDTVKVSDLKTDHDLVNDADKGNESLYTGLGSVQTLAQGLNTKTAGIERDTTGTAATTIEGKLKVSSDGTVKINEGEDQQVIIDSNGIKVGKNSSRMNDSYGFATTKDLYIGADSADAPTAAGSKFYVKGSDGSIKAANGKFFVDGNGDITASGLTTKKITAGKSSATDPEFMVDEDGNLTSKGKLSAANGLFSVDDQGALSAANGAFSVDLMGSVVTKGSVRLNSGLNSTQLTAGGVSFIKDGMTTKIEGDTVTVSSSGVNKSFNLSDIADVGQNMTNLGNRIEAEETKRAQEVSRLDTAISNETTKREQEVSRLDTAISNETTKREQEVSRLDTAISDEKTKREQEVSRLDTAISDEKTKREQEVSRLDTAINDEKTKRAEEVSRLDTAINDEKTKREQEVSRLDTAINDEKTKREQEVSRLDTAINDEKTKREQEVSRLDTAINDEKTKREQEVSRLDTAINDEKTKREQEVADLNGRVDAVNSRVDSINNDFNTAINDEKTKREHEVSRLDTAINDEKTKREQEVSRLDGRIDTVNTAISDEKTKREQEVSRLDGRIDTVSNNLGDLNDLDSDLQARDEYTGNSSVVGGINAEAAVRKEEVTRLDTAIADEAAARQADVARLDGRISDVSSRINKVGAMAAAISSLKTMGYDPESPTEFSVGLGQYKGETGVALGFFHYPNKNFMINVSLSTSSGEIMGGIGATWRFGHKSPQKLLEEQRAAQAEKEIAAAEAYKAARAAKQAKNAK